MTKIFIDAGHGGTDPGAVGNGLKEKDLTLKIATKVKIMLEDYKDVSVKMSRAGDTYPSLSARTKVANEWDADFFLSIHINAGGGTGYEDYIYTSASAMAKEYQSTNHVEIMKQIDMKDRGKKSANYQVLRTSSMPAILTECGFIDNAGDAAKLKQIGNDGTANVSPNQMTLEDVTEEENGRFEAEPDTQKEDDDPFATDLSDDDSLE
ncbi:N-acetylmuramoyl-L-alanine amidase [Peribacillus butanolivorans]|uniref:N-acetylmuramoyl-L-alanine amidase n=1 Tax=Peribacillus butanolivorans TaxID=421767 RepID=UPI0006A6C025|nr:N-acetylmuramoyl-L-alanine amidase [Peribacillus butanolivorans]